MLVVEADELAPSSKYVTWQADQPVKLRLSDSGPPARKPLTVVTAFKQAARRFPNHPALGNFSLQCSPLFNSNL